MSAIKMTVVLAGTLAHGRKATSWKDCSRVHRKDLPTGLQRFAFSDVYEGPGLNPALMDFKRRDLPSVFLMVNGDGEWVIDQAGTGPGDVIQPGGRGVPCGYGYARYIAKVL